MLQTVTGTLAPALKMEDRKTAMAGFKEGIMPRWGRIELLR